MEERYRFTQDSDCHWYMIPESLMPVWRELSPRDDAWKDERWDEIDECRIGCHPSNYTFTAPKCLLTSEVARS